MRWLSFTNMTVCTFIFVSTCAFAQSPPQAFESGPKDRDLPRTEEGVENLGYVYLKNDLFVARTPIADSENISVAFDIKIASNYNNTKFSASAPFDNLEVKAKERRQGTGYSWVGNITNVGRSEEESSATINVIDGMVTSGFFRYDTYTISFTITDDNPPDSKDRNAYLVQVRDSSRLPPGTDPEMLGRDRSAEDKAADLAEAERCYKENTSHTIDVFVFYTPEARDGAVSERAIKGEIQGHIAESDELFEKSGNIKIKLNLIGTELINDFQESHNFTKMLNAALNHKQIKDKRNEVNADIIHIILSKGETTACGKAFIPSSLYEHWDGAVGVVPRWCANEQFSLLHEIGHNLGLGHYSASCPGEGIFDWSCGYAVANKFGTLLRYPPPKRILRLSNSDPQVRYMGERAGDATHDNARTVMQTRCRASGWR